MVETEQLQHQHRHLQLTVFSPELAHRFLDICPNITEKGQEFSNLLYLLEVGSQTRCSAKGLQIIAIVR